LKTLRSQLAPSTANGRARNSFGDAFATDIASVRAALVEDWLRRRDVGPRTRRNMILSLRVLFNYAKSRGHLPKNESTEADALTLPKAKGGDIGIFTPSQLSALLAGSKSHPINDEYRLWVVLGAFTGLRTEEMKRLEWRDVNLATGYIEVTAAKAKTQSRRLVPILPNLASWLAPYAPRKGHVFPRARAEERAHAYAKRLEITWPHNALRHSFATYRLATIHDTPRVALEMGNSPQMIVKHYRELATEAEGKAWFAIMPDVPANVVNMKAAR
jgi:integrase